MPNEKLPTGFTRRASRSLRVQIRLKGHETVVKNFALLAESSTERKRQLAEAQAWAAETRRRMLAGAHVSSREAERTTLGDALRRYEAEGLSGKEGNLKVERYRMQTILNDPIPQRPIAFLGEKDIAAFRDRLIEAGWRKKAAAAVLRLTGRGSNWPIGDWRLRIDNPRKAAVHCRRSTVALGSGPMTTLLSVDILSCRGAHLVGSQHLGSDRETSQTWSVRGKCRPWRRASE